MALSLNSVISSITTWQVEIAYHVQNLFVIEINTQIFVAMGMGQHIALISQVNFLDMVL